MRRLSIHILRSCIFILGMCLLSVAVFSQDIHLSQFTNSTQLYNPALTGQYEQTLKASLLHRKQWRSIGSGYQTNGFDGQYKILSLYSSNYIGTGLLIFQDKAGIADMRTFMVKGSVAYHMVASSKNLLSAGLQLGYMQRSVNADGLAWDSQYNGFSYDPSLPNKERFVNQSKGIVDIGAGFNWKHKGETTYNMGYGVHHARQEIGVLARSSSKYSLRHSLSLGSIKRVGQIDLKFDALVQRQAGAMEILLGTTIDYRIGDDSRYTNVRTSSIVRGGMFYRFNDAMHPFIGFQYKRTAMFSFGYDIRLTRMTNTPGLTGGPEISIAYLGTVGRSRMKIIH